MIQCPKCGAEYKVSPDVCVQCGYDFAPEDSLPDLFAAAMKQEQQSRAQQQAQREAFRKLHGEQHPQHNPEPDMLPELPNDVPETEEPEPLPEAVTQSESRTAPQPKRNNPKWTPYVIGVIAVLVVAAVISMRDGFKPVHSPTDNYAFYLQDQTIWFYRDDTGKKICLTGNGKPEKELSDAQFQALTQLSADGKRVYYPLNFTQSDTCQIAYRELAAPEEEHILTWIRMFPDVKKTVQETGRPGETEAFALTDMLPPYIADGDTLFYCNLNGALCRRQSGGEEEVLSLLPVRYWKVSGMDGIYYLDMSTENSSVLSYTDAKETCRSEQLAWSIMETAVFPCHLQYCPPNGEGRTFYPFPETQILSWAVPYADSDRYFYFLQDTEEGTVMLKQADLVQQGFCDTVGYTSEVQNADVKLLCAYPDGSCYFATVGTPVNAPYNTVDLHFFNRKEAQNYRLYGYIPSDNEDMFSAYIDIFPGKPYLIIGFALVDRPYIFRGSQFVASDMPEEAQNIYWQQFQFDTQYPVNFLTEDPETANYLFSSTLNEDGASVWFEEGADGITVKISNPDGSETEWKPENVPLYVCCAEMNDQGKAVYCSVQNTAADSSYFAFQPEGASAPEIFCWNQKNSELLLPDGQKAQADRIIRKDGGLFCHSGTDNSISIYRDNALQSLTGADMRFSADNWQPLSGDTLLAVSEDRKLVLYTSEQMKTISAAERIIAAGKLPQEKEHTE